MSPRYPYAMRSQAKPSSAAVNESAGILRTERAQGKDLWAGFGFAHAAFSHSLIRHQCCGGQPLIPRSRWILEIHAGKVSRGHNSPYPVTIRRVNSVRLKTRGRNLQTIQPIGDNRPSLTDSMACWIATITRWKGSERRQMSVNKDSSTTRKSAGTAWRILVGSLARLVFRLLKR